MTLPGSRMSWLVGVSSVGSLCAIFVSLIAIYSIVNDVSSLQEEFSTGMAEFRVSPIDRLQAIQGFTY